MVRSQSLWALSSAPLRGGAGVGGVSFTECPLRDFILFFVFVDVALEVFGNRLSVRDGWVVNPLGTIICVSAGGAGVGGLSFARLSCLFRRRRHSVHSRLEAHFWKILVCHKPYETYHLPFRS